MDLPDHIRYILKDRESGSVALLNRLISALEEELYGTVTNAEDFRQMVKFLLSKLSHFAAIYNFLVSLVPLFRQKDAFPENVRRYIADYSAFWSDTPTKIAANLLSQFEPEGLTILTHSHSQTVLSLLEQLQEMQVSFRVFQTLSSPGEEGKISHERMRQMKIQSDLVNEANISEILASTDLILMGCDVLLEKEFLNKTGTRTILEQSKSFNIGSVLVTESRKEITRPDWAKPSSNPLFEWVPLHLIDRIITERSV